MASDPYSLPFPEYRAYLRAQLGYDPLASASVAKSKHHRSAKEIDEELIAMGYKPLPRGNPDIGRSPAESAARADRERLNKWLTARTNNPAPEGAPEPQGTENTDMSASKKSTKKSASKKSVKAESLPVDLGTSEETFPPSKKKAAKAKAAKSVGGHPADSIPGFHKGKEKKPAAEKKPGRADQVMELIANGGATKKAIAEALKITANAAWGALRPLIVAGKIKGMKQDEKAREMLYVRTDS